MGNNTSYYFGAYLEIHTIRRKVPSLYVSCGTQGHEDIYKPHGAAFGFCQLCGRPLKRKPDVMDHITDVYELVDYEGWDDELANVTPPSLYGTGVMLARSNGVADNDDWLYLSAYGNDVEVKPFPDFDEIRGMMADFRKSHGDIIEAIKSSPLVESVEVKAGYVLDAEY